MPQFVIPADQVPIFEAASAKYGYPFNLHTSQTNQESGFDPTCKSGPNTDGSYDRGESQINSLAHPEVSDAQALDPNFAIPWMAQEMRSLYDTYHSWEVALHAYNGGAGAAAAFLSGHPYPECKAYADAIFANAGMNSIWPKCTEIVQLCAELYPLCFSAVDQEFYHGLANAVRDKMGWPDTLPVTKISVD